MMPPTLGPNVIECRLIFAVEFWCDLISKSAQVIDRQVAWLATDEMIFYYLQFLAGQHPIDVLGHLVDGQMSAFRGRNDVSFGAKHR